MFAQAGAYGTEMILARALVIRRRVRALSKLPFSNGCNRLLIKAPSLPYLQYNYCSVSLITRGLAYCSAATIKGGSEDLIKSLVVSMSILNIGDYFHPLFLISDL
ncbi:hypothetical protein AVEN_269922-1 [Araneus ventricosus]|uniref:Uncharacterized protein n=1 Tax=Araneus ventricosus TaxID=182803 RepID=A0A4Y2FPZ6_ARAVE|nr:hypothetical protein AVEN_269922-1 [Araneus ventricosus]